MTALDFPDTPVTGDLFGSAGTVWRWDGVRWASTSGASGPRGVVLRIPTLADGPIIPITPGVATPITNTISFTFKAGRTYRLVLQLRAIEATAMTVTSQLLLNGAVHSDFYERVDAPYQGMHSQYLLSYPSDVTQTVQWCMSSAGMANVHGGGNLCYIEDVTYEAGSAAGFTPPLATMFRSFTATGLSVVTGTTTGVPFADQAGDGVGNIGNPTTGGFTLNEKGLFAVDMLASWSTSFGAPGVVPDLYDMGTGGSLGSQSSIAPWGVIENSWLLDQKSTDLARQFGFRFYNYMPTMSTNITIRVARVSARP